MTVPVDSRAHFKAARSSLCVCSLICAPGRFLNVLIHNVNTRIYVILNDLQETPREGNYTGI